MAICMNLCFVYTSLIIFCFEPFSLKHIRVFFKKKQFNCTNWVLTVKLKNVWGANGNFIDFHFKFCNCLFLYSNEVLIDSGLFTHASSREGNVGQSVHHFSSDWNVSTTIGWIAIKVCTDIHGSQTMNPNDFDDPLTFPLVPPWGWRLWFWVKCLDNCWMNYIIYHHIFRRTKLRPWLIGPEAEIFLLLSHHHMYSNTVLSISDAHHLEESL